MEYNVSARAQNTELKARLERAAARADEAVAGLTPASSPAETCAAVREYVRIRYMLDPEDVQGADSLNYLGELSLAKSLGMSVQQVRKSELDSKCENTSSAMTKKILLVIALNKALGINIDAERTAEVTGLDELGREVASRLAQKREQS